MRPECTRYRPEAFFYVESELVYLFTSVVPLRSVSSLCANSEFHSSPTQRPHPPFGNLI